MNTPNGRMMLLLEAQRLNWEHARHVEQQRIALAIAYAGAMLATGAFLLKDNPPGNGTAHYVCLIGVIITAICWKMTHKWNMVFENQFAKADKCAKELLLHSDTQDSQPLSIHSYIGFPPVTNNFFSISNRSLFGALYGLFGFVWVVLIFKKLFEL